MNQPRQQPKRRALLATALAVSLPLCLASVTGCKSLGLGSKEDKPSGFRPPDFVNPDSKTAGTGDNDASSGDNLTQGDQGSSSDKRPDGTGVKIDNPASEALAVNAMVGHINGEAVYADQIFNIDVAAQLEAYGRRYGRNDFLNQASPVIRERLRGVIINKLILGEAERNLKKQHRDAIDNQIQLQREELVRFYGQGSISKAKAEFRKARSQGMEKFLVQEREKLSIAVYIRSKVLPKIVVNQRDVERWYEDNRSKFDTPDQRVIRIIRAKSPEDAKAVSKRLKSGEGFKSVAGDGKLNDYNASNSGIFNSGEALPGKIIFAVEPVNDALLKLKEGEHAGPIPAGKNHYFVQVVSFTPGKKVPLADAQLQIEKALRALQFERHAIRFREGLLERGSYTDPDQMGVKLLEIAYARYEQ